MSEILGETKTICAAFGLLGCISFQSGDYGVAKSYLLKALALDREIEDKPGEAEILNDLGYLILPFGSYAEEKRYLAEALRLYREMDNKEGIYCVVDNLGTISRFEGDIDAAKSRYRMSLTMKRDFGQRLPIAHSLEGMACIEVSLANGQRAARMIGAASEWREAADGPVQAHRYAEYENTISSACAQIGQEAFLAECARGRK